MEDLAKRAVACKGWRWMKGMVVSCTVMGELCHGAVLECAFLDDGVWRLGAGEFDFEGETVPDLTHPATLGCLLRLVRDAWGDGDMCSVPRDMPGDRGSWYVEARGRDAITLFWGDTEAGALVTALEAAP